MISGMRNLLPRHPELAAFYAGADLIEIDSTPLIAFAAPRSASATVPSLHLS